MNRRWLFAPVQPIPASELASALSVSSLLGQCLLNRGLNDCSQVARFLEPRLKQLSDPFLLPNMRVAVERLYLARARRERVALFGDYDVDGVTSTALLTEVLQRLGWCVAHYLPHRLEEGYGLSEDAVENCLRKTGGTLLLAVDCGSTSTGTIAALKARGIDTIVLDHHQVCSPAPAAVALVNPQLTDSTTPSFRELCSAGLAFKLAHALVKLGRQNSLPEAMEFDLRPFLDLVALGTIADLVPLTGENRILVAAGLERLNRLERPGVAALARQAGVSGRIGVFEVGFQLAPRLNAAGRVENALQSLELLLATDPDTAEALARALDLQNQQRQQIERGIAEEVIRAVRARFNPETDFVIVEGQLPWHLGVVGIVASRVLREFYRPTIIVGGDGQEWRGSGRSIEGFDLAAALRSCADLLTRHGGHAMAAGVSLPNSNLDLFRVRLNEVARRNLTPEVLQPILRIDAEVRLGELTISALSEIDRLEPFGQGNPAVQLVGRSLRQVRPPQRVGKEGRHVKMWVSDGTTTQPALWWNCAENRLPEGPFDLVFVPEINEYNQLRSVQLRVLDWKPSAG